MKLKQKFLMYKKLRRLLKNVFAFSINLINYIIDTCVLTFIGRSTQKNGLAIVRMDSIGDFILWLDAAKEFRKLYPDTKIILIANQLWSCLAELLSYWDEVISIDRNAFLSNPFYHFKRSIRIRLLNVAQAIHPTFSREYLYGDCIIRCTKAALKIGSVGDYNNITSRQKYISDQWYSRLLSATSQPLMELQRNAEFMRNLGAINISVSLPVLHKLVDLPNKLTISGPYFIIFPGAFWSGRSWPIEKYATLLSRLTASNLGLGILCGSPQERTLCDRVIAASNSKAINFSGHTSLPELVELIRGANVLIGNETSSIHIAAAVGTPSVCILGGGHYGRFLPYDDEVSHLPAVPIPVVHKMDCFGCNWQCTQHHEEGKAVPCISEINVDQVLEAIEHSSQQQIRDINMNPF